MNSEPASTQNFNLIPLMLNAKSHPEAEMRVKFNFHVKKTFTICSHGSDVGSRVNKRLKYSHYQRTVTDQDKANVIQFNQLENIGFLILYINVP